MGLWYPKDSGIELTAFLDTDHACCIDTRKSTSGGIQFLGEKLVSWMSKKQDCSAMSSTEAETEYQLADMFMKAFPQDRFEYLVRRIGMRCLTPAELEGNLEEATAVRKAITLLRQAIGLSLGENTGTARPESTRGDSIIDE
ncbi:hypothetical protein Tco_0685818 [Tanacetum coccineum]